MRPGRLTPENQGHVRPEKSVLLSFNEAGAINPGKPSRASDFRWRKDRFNEAGAINPGKPNSLTSNISCCWGFNEAGAINPGKPVA